MSHAATIWPHVEKRGDHVRVARIGVLQFSSPAAAADDDPFRQRMAMNARECIGDEYVS